VPPLLLTTPLAAAVNLEAAVDALAAVLAAARPEEGDGAGERRAHGRTRRTANVQPVEERIVEPG